MTNPFGQTVAGLLAAFILWTLVRAFRQGVVHSENGSYDLEQNPLGFTALVIVHGLGVAFFLYIAAGYEPATFWRWVLGG